MAGQIASGGEPRVPHSSVGIIASESWLGDVTTHPRGLPGDWLRCPRRRRRLIAAVAERMLQLQDFGGWQGRSSARSLRLKRFSKGCGSQKVTTASTDCLDTSTLPIAVKRKRAEFLLSEARSSSTVR